MMSRERYRAIPTRADAERLIAWLPVLYASDFRIDLPREERSSPEGWWPEYTPEVEAFYAELARVEWVDYCYNPPVVGELLTPERIAIATLPELRSMLTYCMRMERFWEGLWRVAIEDGIIRCLLERMTVLLKAGVFDHCAE